MPSLLNLPSMSSRGEGGGRRQEERKFRHACTQENLAKEKMKGQIDIYILAVEGNIPGLLSEREAEVHSGTKHREPRDAEGSRDKRE